MPPPATRSTRSRLIGRLLTRRAAIRPSVLRGSAGRLSVGLALLLVPGTALSGGQVAGHFAAGHLAGQHFAGRHLAGRHLGTGQQSWFGDALGGALGAVQGATGSVGEPPHPPVTVSLTFDDAIADQAQAGPMLATYGMRGTFFVNSGRLGTSGYMTASQVNALQDAGNEVGGHTVSHADLPTLGQDEAARQICNDRVALLNAGLRVSNFAYPFGDENPTVEHIVQSCGYNSARGVGNVVSPGTCDGCPYAEHLPPVNRYDIATPDSIKVGTTLADMQNYVLQAEQNGGGWVALVMHHVCDGCDTYSVGPSQLDAFLSWLAARAIDGTTVATVADVIGGDLQPPVSGPAAPPPGSQSNVITNPSLEADADHNGLPDCWQRAGYGTNSFSWSNVSDAHDGNVAERMDITSFTDGDRRLITPQDLGACAPVAVTGHTYNFTGWYKASGQVRVVAYYRSSTGGWIYFSQGPILPTNPTTYQRTAWTTPPIPSGATALSVGYSLRSTGFVTGDDFSLSDSDLWGPTVALTWPNDGDRVSGTVRLAADASDASGVDHVDFLVHGVVVCTDTTAPYRCDWDTTSAPDDVVAVTARAVDTAHNVTLSAGRSFTVANSVAPDPTAPNVALTSPTSGSTLHGPVTLSASASDDDAVSQVMFFVDGSEVASTATEPYEVSWDSSSVPDGTVTVTAKAIDRSGNETTSAPVTVTVSNPANQDTAPPESSIKCNNVACADTWYSSPVSITMAAIDTDSGVASIRYTTDGTQPTATNGNSYTGAFSLGATTLVRYRAYDRAGNAEDVHDRTLNFDTTPPTGAILTPANGATITGTYYFKADVADNVGIARVWFYCDGKSLGTRVVSPYQWKWDTSTIAKGPHTLSIQVSDLAGNITKPPSIAITVS